MPGVAGWDDLHNDVTAAVDLIMDLSDEDIEAIKARCAKAVEDEKDLNKKKALALRLKGTLESIAKGGVKAAIFGALGI